jgi:hypothetical protein
MSTQVLPERPDMQYVPVQAPPQKKRHGWLIALGVAGALVVAGGVGSAVTQADQASTSTPAVSAPDAPIVDAPVSGDPYTEAVPLLEQVTNELGAITETSSATSDVAHLNRAGDLCSQASDLFVGFDDTQAMYLDSAAGHLYAAADAVSQGDWGTGADEMAAFSSDIEAATAALDTTGTASF